MNHISHFEIPADDVERAKRFYEKTFGWKISRFQIPEGDYWLVKTPEADEKSKTLQPGGINGGLMKRLNPGQPFMNYITVESIDEMSKTIKANGGTMILPKQEIGKGMGWLAAFKDTENNIMGLHQKPEKMQK